MSSYKANDTVGGLTQRQRRVGEEVRGLISECLARESFYVEGFNPAAVTITEVRMSIDLKHAFAFVMPLGGENVQETIAALKEVAPQIRTYLSKKLRLRLAPVVHFEEDKTFEQVERLETLLRSKQVAQDIK